MDRAKLAQILDQVFTEYNHVQDLDARGYYLADHSEVGVILLARLIDKRVFIERDTTDRPLLKTLVAKGIPREQIQAVYLGETTI